MTTILFNGSYEFEIDGYNRYTSINDGVISSNASVSFADPEQFNNLEEMSKNTITDLKILKDQTVIYHLSNQHARIANISESLITDRIAINAQILFDIDGDTVG